MSKLGDWWRSLATEPPVVPAQLVRPVPSTVWGGVKRPPAGPQGFALSLADDDPTLVRLSKQIRAAMPSAEADAMLVHLSKSRQVLSAFGLQAHVAEVVWMQDLSDSMGKFFKVNPRTGRSRMMVFNRQLMPVGMQLDDNQAIDSFVFSKGVDYLGELTLKTLQGFIAKMTAHELFGFGTRFAEAVMAVVELYRRRLHNGDHDTSMPMCVVWVTDGAPSDAHTVIDAAFRAAGDLPIFFLILGINNPEFGSDFRYMQALERNAHRARVANVGFEDISDFENLRDEDLYRMIVTKYSRWIAAAKAAGVLR